MRMTAPKPWALFAFALLALVAVFAVLWWTKVNREEIPAPIVIGRDNSKPRRLPRFSEILSTNPVTTIRIDYALLSVVRPPLQPGLMPGITAGEAKVADSTRYSWDDPVFDDIQGRLTKIEKGDGAAWKRSLQGFQGEFRGLNIEVVSAGSVGNTYEGGIFVKPLHIKIEPQAGDPLKAGYEGNYLLAPSRENRLVGFRNASATSVAYGVPAWWIPIDIGNGETEVMKLFETMTTYCIVVLRFTAAAKSGGTSFGLSGGARGKPVEDKATLIKQMLEGQRRAKQPPPKLVLPKLQ
jgi:hypothetical protein